MGEQVKIDRPLDISIFERKLFDGVAGLCTIRTKAVYMYWCILSQECIDTRTKRKLKV